MIGIFLVYSIKVALCLMAFYLLHKLLLSRDTFHHFNRVSLLGLMAVSLLLPFIHVSLPETMPAPAGMVNLEALMAQATVPMEEAKSGNSPTQIMFAIYLVGTACFIVREALSLLRLHHIIVKAKTRYDEDGIHTIILDRDVAPFSWFNYIFLSRKDYLDHPQEILLHERAHATHRHSLDILFCDLLLTFQWYNPAAWLLRQELQSVHEYEADETVLASGVNAREYQLLLIRKAVGNHLFTMANNFNHNSLKKRINMMLTKKSSPWCRVKLLVTIPFAAMAVVAFANEKAVRVSQEIESEGNQLVTSITQGESLLPTSTPTSTVPAAGKPAREATDTLKTKTDKVGKPKIVPYVIVDGKEIDYKQVGAIPISDIDSVVVFKGKQATEKYGEKAANGAIVIKTKENTVTVISASLTKGDNADGEYKGEPYFLINTKPATKEEVGNIEKGNIESIMILKGEQATKQYGEKAVNGAVVIKTKNP